MWLNSREQLLKGTCGDIVFSTAVSRQLLSGFKTELWTSYQVGGFFFLSPLPSLLWMVQVKHHSRVQTRRCKCFMEFIISIGHPDTRCMFAAGVNLTQCPLCTVLQVSSGLWSVSHILSATSALLFLRPMPQKPFAVSCTEVMYLHTLHNAHRFHNGLFSGVWFACVRVRCMHTARLVIHNNTAS